MASDALHLRVLANAANDPKESANAEAVLSLMEKGKHWILVTLLLCNIVINESLPIFLDSEIGGGIAAIFISTATIVVFGQRVSPRRWLAVPYTVYNRILIIQITSTNADRIIPKAVCAKYGLAVGARSATPVLILMYLLSPITYPIAKLLGWARGTEVPKTYKKAELKSLLQFHRNTSVGSYLSPTEESALPLTDGEVNILNGVLSLSEKGVTDIMTPMDDVVTLSADRVLDHETMDKILASGYSRFPVHEPDQPLSFRGFLLVKKLLLYDPSQPKRVGEFRLTVLPEARPTINCFQALDYFRTGRAHLLLISKTPGQSGGALGIVSLEAPSPITSTYASFRPTETMKKDIFEAMISDQIVDETDFYEDQPTKRRAERQSTAAIMRGIVERQNFKRRMSDDDF
ncbi:hypothetical protein FRC01_004447 [Tulasnella sp. 417]|nr:hypothetical protein FRC01_004447 [Tulasnella sp. 417]